MFAEKGFDGTSIRNIASSAGVNIAMISYYFGSKEKLLEQLFLYRASDLKIQLENLLREALTPFEKIDRLIELYLARVNKNRCIYQILHFEISVNRRALNMEVFHEIKKENILALEKIIREGQEKNIFASNVNIALIPPTILGTFFHFTMNKPFYRNIFNIENDADFEAYIANELTKHLKQTIKALLTNEK
ncbi:MAG: TetR/AcrR family transcriptional regulator [Flavobacterium sp.]|nr:MAG: TetR/AcrR family transcriptional regulator [Flavobacterium sp.]